MISEKRSSSDICLSVARARSSGEGSAGLDGIDITCANVEWLLVDAASAATPVSFENCRRANQIRMTSSWSGRTRDHTAVHIKVTGTVFLRAHRRRPERELQL